MAKTYQIITMGCQMNERDSETIAGLLQQAGYVPLSEKSAWLPGSAEPEGPASGGARDADITVVNTCSVRENADNRFFGLLGQMKHIKERNPRAVIAACGCMMQQDAVTRRIREKHPWVDLVFGTHNIHELPDLLAEAEARNRIAVEEDAAPGGGAAAYPGRIAKTAGPLVRIQAERAGIAENLPAARSFRFKAYVNIMYGCDNYCTYCIVPYTRGREVSREPEAILDEVRTLAEAGAKEVTLLGQNVNSYSGVFARGGEALIKGNPPGHAKGETDFPRLLRQVNAIEGLARIRFMTSHPKDLSDRLIALFARGADGCSAAGGLSKLCPSIHLPVQAGSTRVLTRMNRRYTKEAYLELVRKLRAANPEIVITTDFIVGFPGETDEDFEETMDLIERARFDSAFTFLYSPRPGTPAADYAEQVPESIKHARFDRMVERLNAISLEKNRLYVGSTEEVLAEGPAKAGAGRFAGRTFGGKLVNFSMDGGSGADTHSASLAGRFLPVRITEANTFSLTGIVAS